MSKLIQASINCTKIDKALLYKGKKGLYANLTIWLHDQPDQYGNDITIEQRTGKDQEKIYLGNGKIFVRKEEPEPEPETRQFTPDPPEYNDLPF